MDSAVFHDSNGIHAEFSTVRDISKTFKKLYGQTGLKTQRTDKYAIPSTLWLLRRVIYIFGVVS